MSRYQIVESVLAGVFGNPIGYSDAEVVAQLQRDLSYQPFRDGIGEELSQAFADNQVSWKRLLQESDVCDFETEEEAREFVRELIFDVVFDKRAK